MDRSSRQEAEGRLLLRLPDGQRGRGHELRPLGRPRGALDRALPGRALLAALPRLRADVPPAHALGDPRRPAGSEEAARIAYSRRPGRLEGLPEELQRGPRRRLHRPLAGLLRPPQADQASRSTRSRRSASASSRPCSSAATCSCEGRALRRRLPEDPGCSSGDETGCVVAFSTFDGPVPADARFGRPDDSFFGGDPATEDVLCTDPSRSRRPGTGRCASSARASPSRRARRSAPPPRRSA